MHWYNGIDCALDESEISNITSQLSTVVLNRTSQTENIKASSVLSDKPIEAVRALTYHNNLTSKPSSLDESEYLNNLSISDCTLSSTTEINSVVEVYTESLKFSAKNERQSVNTLRWEAIPRIENQRRVPIGLKLEMTIVQNDSN
jgi:hypothetical protein